MGRKLFEVIIVLASFLAFGLIFAMGNPTFASNDLRVYVKMQPQNPNSIELLLYNPSKNPEVGVNLPTKIIDWQKSNYKLFYVWDDLNNLPIEYREPFAPLEGEHWLFAYSKNMADQSISVVTKFFVQFRRTPRVQPAEQIFVSGETVKWGTGGLEGIEGVDEKRGQITEEATSTAKIATASASNAAQANAAAALNYIQRLVSGRTNLWIMLLMIGLFLLVAMKIIFKEKK